MFNDTQKTIALNFARTLTNRDYAAAYAMCSKHLQSELSEEELQQEFERMIPPDWGDIKPIALEDSADFPFVYVVLDGDTHSEAIVIDAFQTEGGQVKIDEFEFGRP
jgi:hypothetical protein